jgi:small conductance mechanosensitive channel
MQTLLVQLQAWIAGFGFKTIAALVILVIGMRVAQLLSRAVRSGLRRGGVDATLVSFTANAAYVGAIALVGIIALGQIGVETASFIAILGSAGLAIGLALQGSLSNFAAGILLIFFRPFKVGDFIEGAGVSGTVEEIQMLTTTLTTPDNRAVIVPNRKLFEENITNYSVKPQRRLDLVFNIPRQHDIDKIKQMIWELLADDHRVLCEPPARVGILSSSCPPGTSELGITLAVRPWVNTRDYWDVYFDLQEAINKCLDTQNVRTLVS